MNYIRILISAFGELQNRHHHVHHHHHHHAWSMTGQDPAEEGDPNSCGEPADDEVVRLGSSEALSDVPGEDEGMADIIADMAATIENLTSLERRALSSSQQ